MVETSGTQLCSMLPNTTPWSGIDCTRVDCFTCKQGDESLIDCKARSVLYESVCWACEKKEEALEKGKEDKKSKKALSKHGGVYVGETARSLYERAGEHGDDAEKQDEDSHMVKHWLLQHPEAALLPEFRFRIVASFQDSLTRQIAESVRIDRRQGGVLNSKTEYSRCKLPRLMVDVEEWKKQRDIMMEVEQVRDKRIVDKLREDENLLLNTGNGTQKRRSEEFNDGQHGTKRVRKKLRLEPLTEWGENPVEEEVGMMKKWLQET